ncbi:MAG: hypothetical protein AAFU03_11520 [Bacteroidota bacterium]
MKRFSTTVVERRKRFQSNFNSHPMETAWASEAIFFVHVETVEGEDAALKLAVQISPDGVNWVNEGTFFPVLKKEGTSFVKLNHFGGFLRLAGEISGEHPGFLITVHLVLKE